MPLYGPKWPLKRGTRDTYELILTKKQLIAQHLKCVLLTSPGENISDFSYGVGLRRYLFDMHNDSSYNIIRNRIMDQVSFYIPEIRLVDVIINDNPDDIDDNLLNIKIIYQLDNTIVETTVNFDGTENIGFN